MTVGLGVIGCGEHALRSHIQVMGPNAKVMAIYDLSSTAVSNMLKLTGRKGVKVCWSEAEVAAHPLVDAVLIMTPDNTHPELLEMVVKAGKHVLCEKPLATNRNGMRRVRRALTTAQERGLHVASCHMRRAPGIDDLPYGWLKANFAKLEQLYGPLLRIEFISNYPAPTQQWKLTRSFLADKITHDLDYLRYLLGDVRFTAQRLFDSHDHYKVIGQAQRPGGTTVSFDCVGMRLHAARGQFIELVTLNFERGVCEVQVSPGTVRLRDNSAGGKRDMQITPMTDEGYQRGFAGVMAEFVGMLEGTRAPAHSPTELLVLNEAAVELSGLTGRYGW